MEHNSFYDEYIANRKVGYKALENSLKQIFEKYKDIVNDRDVIRFFRALSRFEVKNIEFYRGLLNAMPNSEAIIKMYKDLTTYKTWYDEEFRPKIVDLDNIDVSMPNEDGIYPSFNWFSVLNYFEFISPNASTLLL